MQEPTKTRLINDRHLLIVSCPCGSVGPVMDWLKQNGCAVNDATPDEDDEGIPAEVVSGKSSPGTHLRGYRYRDDLTQVELAKLAGIPRRHISDMENGRRPIGRHNAQKLAEVFKTDPRMFL